MSVFTLIQAINQALREEMTLDPRVLLLGEDVGINGGVFRATEGLYAEFGPSRVLDTPLSENGIVGAAIGLAVNGMRPVAEVQFSDFIYPAFDQIVTEMSKIRYRSGGQFSVPVVVRAPYGAGIKAGPYHSQSPESYFIHTAGLKVVIPSTPHDAKGLLKASIREEDPVIFLEPKKIYRAVKGEVPKDDYIVPLGQANTVRAGSDVSIFSFGAMIHVCLEAAEKADTLGINTEVVDLRTLMPLDIDAIIKSVTKTGRVVVVHEAPKTLGIGAEISSLIMEKALLSLHAPVARVAGPDTPVPLTLENAYLPSSDRVLSAIQKVMKF